MFNFLWWDLHFLKAGQFVDIDISTAANVKLISYSNFTTYKNGGRYRFHGGFAKNSPYRIEVPHDGKWILVVDLTEPYTSFFGYMKVNHIKISTPATTSHTQQEVITLPPNEATAKENTECFDIFLSHATEDKDTIAIPLKDELEKLGLKIWMDVDRSNELSTSGLRREIDSAIYNSNYAVIILSPNYMRKPWTNREFDGITAMEMAKKQTLLCVWHHVTLDAILEYSPPIANKYAHETTTYSIQEIAKAFARIITASKKDAAG